MKPSDLKNFIRARVKNKIRRPLLIEGAPGGGKTQIVAQVADEEDLQFIHIHAPLLLPEDYGLPVPNKDKTAVTFIVPTSKFPLEGSDWDDEGIMLIDELSQADIPTQKAMANLLQEREVHGHKLKKGWRIIATGNRQSDRAGANKILSHLGNRVSRITLDISIDDWTKWSLENDIKTEVISFIQFRPDLLSNFDPNNEINATPRSWVEGVSDQLGLIDTKLEHEAFAGDVGPGPAAEFIGFVKIYRELPDIDDLIKNPTKAIVQKDPAVIYAIIGALVSKTTKITFEPCLTYVKRLPPEYMVLYVKQAIEKDKAVRVTKAFINWATKEGADLLG